MGKEKANFNARLHLACSKDESRPIMGCVHFKDGFAYASNGFITVKQSLEYHSLEDVKNLDGVSIHRDNFAAILSFQFATATPDGVDCRDEDGRTAFFAYFDRHGKEIPDFETLMKTTQAKTMGFIGINPDNLKSLGDVMLKGSAGLRLTFSGIDKPIFVDDLMYENQLGILMPQILEASLF